MSWRRKKQDPHEDSEMNETRAIRTELRQLSDRTPVRLPLAVLLSLLITVAGAAATYGAMKTRMEASERRVEKLESANLAVQKLLERIDERTAAAAKSTERIEQALMQHLNEKR